MLARCTEAGDCRVHGKAAVLGAGAAEFRELTLSGSGLRANQDCRFPLLSAAGPLEYTSTTRSTSRASLNTEHHAEPHPTGTRTPLVRGSRSQELGHTIPPLHTAGRRPAWRKASALTPSPAAIRATWANVARDRAKSGGGGDRLFPPFSPAAPGSPTIVSHQALPGKMDDRAHVPGFGDSGSRKPRSKEMAGVHEVGSDYSSPERRAA
jgi:hypothetical protein